MAQEKSMKEGPEWPAPSGGTGSPQYDPVCDMKVIPESAAATSAYKGKTYYFCTVGCKKAFDKNPEKYLAKEK